MYLDERERDENDPERERDEQDRLNGRAKLFDNSTFSRQCFHRFCTLEDQNSKSTKPKSVARLSLPIVN